MDISIFSVLILAVLLLALLIRRLIFQPERVFTDNGDSVLLCKSPNSLNSNKSKPQVIRKKAIIRIQLASDIVTLFYKGGNAIDIPVPNPKFTEQVFRSAKEHFEQAEVTIISS